MENEIEVRHYVDASGKDVFGEWLGGLADLRARAKIAARVARLGTGNFGDYKSLGRGLCELRIDWGSGYRVYYSRVGAYCILLLCGGDKRKQVSDIERSFNYLTDYKSRAEKR